MRARGAVACGHPETARAAAGALEDGGNAFDAALAGMCAACVAEPVLASLGGGGFLLARPNQGRLQGETIVYDFFVDTPATPRSEADTDFVPVLADFGFTQQEFHIGMGAIATPGIARGLFEAHGDLGVLPMRHICEPAVRLARDGLRVDAMQAYIIRVVGAILKHSRASWAVFESPHRPGELIGEGERLRMPEFADALDVLAVEGPDLFYRGEIARRIVRDCAANGGHLILADLESYRVERRRSLTLDAFNARIHFNPPPSSGGVLIAFALEMMRSMDLKTLDPRTAPYLERLANVMEVTNRARVDHRLQDLDPETVADTLLNPQTLAAYRDRVLGHRPAVRGTTHISVIDAASLSLSNGEGSGYVVPGTGIMLNNMLGEEDINPHRVHRWPRKSRMSSMMTPTLLLRPDGGLIALGSGGSNRIRTAILQVLLNLTAFGMPLEDAVAAPRIHAEDQRLSVEPGFPEGDIDALAPSFAGVDRWETRNLFFGGVHAVRRERDGGFVGAGDERRGGAALIV